MPADTGALDRRVVVMRSAQTDDGTATVTGPPEEIGRRWMSKTDISDAEQVRAAQNGEEVSAWFVARSDSLTRTITGKDVLVLLERNAQPIADGRIYEVTGTKEIGRRDRIEITAASKPDAGA